MNDMNDWMDSYENVCPVCGKVFLTGLGREWGWRYRGSNYCSYKCMRHVEIRHLVKAGHHYDLTPWEHLSSTGNSVRKDVTRVRRLNRSAKEALAASRLAGGVEAEELQRVAETLKGQADRIWGGYQLPSSLLSREKQSVLREVTEGDEPKKIAFRHDMDTDLLAVKLCIIFEEIAKQMD